MISVLLALALLPFTPAQEEKKAPPAPPSQDKKETPERKDAAPQDQEKPPADRKPEEEKPVPQEPADDERSGVDLTAELRVGGWWMGKFNALIPAGHRSIDSTLLLDAGVDLQAECAGWTLTLGGDYGTGKNLKMEMGGALFGYKFILDDHDPVFDVHVGAGPIFGRLDVDVTNFGDFKSAVGFEARVDATAWLNNRIGLGLWLDYRELRFKFDEDVIHGDKHAGGSMFAVGASFTLGF